MHGTVVLNFFVSKSLYTLKHWRPKKAFVYSDHVIEYIMYYKLKPNLKYLLLYLKNNKTIKC